MKNIPYSEIKSWYLENKDSLKKIIECKDRIYLDSRQAFETNIEEMDAHIKKHGSKANTLSAARACYHRLNELYHAATDPDQRWSLIKPGHPEWEPVIPNTAWKIQTK